MAIQVSVDNVLFPQHVFFFGNPPGPDDHDLDTIQVLTGWVVVDFRETSGHTRREDFQSFVPIGKLFSNPTISRIAPYDNVVADEEVMSTAMVAPAAVTEPEDENLFAVDSAFARLERQRHLPGGPRSCLVLHVNAAVRNATIIRFSYQVTIRTVRRGPMPQPIEISGVAPEPT